MTFETKNRKKLEIFFHFGLTFFFSIFLSSCANELLKYKDNEHLKQSLQRIDEFDKQVSINFSKEEKEILPDSPKEKTPQASMIKESERGKARTPFKKKFGKIKKKDGLVSSQEKIGIKHEPELEGSMGFLGRRPVIDPFQVGERLEYTVYYLNLSAAKLTIETRPFAKVNGQKSYHFGISAETTSLFSLYFLKNSATTLLNYNSLVPSVYTLHANETSQLKEARYLFDPNKGTATYWEKKVTPKEGEQEKRIQWEVPDYSQNVISSFFYLRVFPWEVGDEHSFRVADQGENLILIGKAVRKETIKVVAGEFETIVIVPRVELQGAPKPMDEIHLWLSNDARKIPIRIKANLKFGSLLMEADQLSLDQ